MRKKSYLNIILTFLLMTITISSLFFINNLIENMYIYYLIFTTIILGIFYKSNTEKGNISPLGPTSIVFGIYFIYYLGGVVIYFLRSIWFYNYRGDMNYVSLLYSISILVSVSIFQFLLIYKNKRNSKIKSITNHINVSFYYIYTLFILIVGWTASSKIYSGFTNIPLFAVNKDLARVQLNMSGFTWALMLFLIQNVLICSYVLYHKMFKKYKINRVFTIIVLVLSFVPLMFNSSRSIIILPILICVIYVFNDRGVKFRNLVGLVVTTIAASNLYLYIRLFNNFTFSTELLKQVVLQDSFNELRMLSISLRFMKPKYFTNIVTNNILSLIPSEVLSIIGINKRELQHIGEIILNNIAHEINAGKILGIRVSIIGETYLAGGIIMIIIMSILIAVFAFINEIKFCKKYYDRFFILINVICFAFLIPYGYNFIVTYITIVLQSVVTKKVLFKDS